MREADELFAALSLRLTDAERGRGRLLDVLEKRSTTEQWAELPLVCSAFPTRLDGTPFLYVLKDEWPVMEYFGGWRSSSDRVEARIGNVDVYLVGYHAGKRRTMLDPELWRQLEDVGYPSDPARALESERSAALLEFCRVARRDAAAAAGRLGSYRQANDEATRYFILHRKLVVAVGRELGVDMKDHDLTKTTVVQLALGTRWHWPAADDDPPSSEIARLADVAVRLGHLCEEDHHPEYAGRGPVDVRKLFADRLAVHLQKDEPDGRGGWAVDARFIPEAYRSEWEAFKAEHEGTDLNRIPVDDDDSAVRE